MKLQNPIPTNRIAQPSIFESAKDWRKYDVQRPSFKGEHWLTMGTGLALLLAARRSRSPITRKLGSAAGGALLLRAASGRDGVAKLLRYLPLGRSRF